MEDALSEQGYRPAIVTAHLGDRTYCSSWFLAKKVEGEGWELWCPELEDGQIIFADKDADMSVSFL